MCNEQKILYARILGILSMTGVLNGITETFRVFRM